MMTARHALFILLLLVGITTTLILLLPFPNSLFVLFVMAWCYALEIFYQVRKRNQRFPLAQLAGRIDFALFPVAGYLCIGSPDLPAFLYLLFFYPFALAHLGVNDLVDYQNDQARGMYSITVLYGLPGTVRWISGFCAVHACTALLFMVVLGWIGRIGLLAGLGLLLAANLVILRKQTSAAGLSALPIFHVTMIVYAVSIIGDSVL
jgi:4-hydroxybenzoate polyprenyltransferase